MNKTVNNTKNFLKTVLILSIECRKSILRCGIVSSIGAGIDN